MKLNAILLVLLLPLLSIGQSPQKINFQSVLRNSAGEFLSNKSVSIRISILSGSATGTNVYSETHSKTTDASGLMSIQIGNGTVVSGIFSSIDWGSTAHFIKLEADFNGGTNFVLLGTQELMSVPYALYASKTDTSVLNLTNRLATKLNISDTARMLTNYRTELTNKVNISDTASMLLNYLRKSDEVITELQNQLRLMQSNFKIFDVDGNSYRIISIGSQTWMAENLRVSRYRNGNIIPILANNTDWSSAITGARCWNLNDSLTYEVPYGNLYNWYSVMDNRGICPDGWHLPSENEWKILIDYLGGFNTAPKKLLIGSTFGKANKITENESGFSSIMGGLRLEDGGFTDFGNWSLMWSSSGNSTNVYARYIILGYVSENSQIISVGSFNSTNKSVGTSIRCLKD